MSRASVRSFYPGAGVGEAVAGSHEQNWRASYGNRCVAKKIELGPEVSSRSLVAQLVKEGFRVPVIAKALELNRTYCDSLLKEPVKKAKKAVIEKDALLKQRIRHLCERFPRYGYRRIKVMLRRQYSMQVNHKRVHRLMREMGLLVKSPQREASRKKRSGKIPVSQSNEHFQCDMTKIWCGKDGWGYLFAVIDAYDREIVGYSFSRYCRTEELLHAVDNAFNY